MDERSVEFVNKFGMVFEQLGSTRSAGLIWGWLMVSPEPQSLDDLATGLSLSKASISVYTRLLEQMGVIERVAVRGDRKTYYQACERAWELILQFGVRKLELLTNLARDGLGITTDPRVRNRFETMEDCLSFLSNEYKLLIKRFYDRNTKTEK